MLANRVSVSRQESPALFQNGNSSLGFTIGFAIGFNWHFRNRFQNCNRHCVVRAKLVVGFTGSLARVVCCGHVPYRFSSGKSPANFNSANTPSVSNGQSPINLIRRHPVVRFQSISRLRSSCGILPFDFKPRIATLFRSRHLGIRLHEIFRRLRFSIPVR